MAADLFCYRRIVETLFCVISFSFWCVQSPSSICPSSLLLKRDEFLVSFDRDQVGKTKPNVGVACLLLTRWSFRLLTLSYTRTTSSVEGRRLPIDDLWRSHATASDEVVLLAITKRMGRYRHCRTPKTILFSRDFLSEVAFLFVLNKLPCRYVPWCDGVLLSTVYPCWCAQLSSYPCNPF